MNPLPQATAAPAQHAPAEHAAAEHAAAEHMQQPHSAKPQQLPVRYDGNAKVTGQAKYSYEFAAPGVVYACLITSSIASGTISAMDTAAAGKLPGVLAIMTPFNAPRLPVPKADPPATRHVNLLQDSDVAYSNQPIGVVIAESLEQARYAAGMVKVSYAPKPARMNFHKRLGDARPPKKGKEFYDKTRGDMDQALSHAAVKIDVVYTTPIQHHNAMEPHATVAWWQGDKLTVHDSTQYISGCRQTLAHTLGIPIDNVHVECPYTGGGFGSKGSTWSHVLLTAMAAKLVGKPVKLALERSQMFGPVGARPQTVQHLKLAATTEGKLLGVEHANVCHVSVMEDFVEFSANATRMLYTSDANVTSHAVVEMNLGNGTYMRAPGEASGMVGLECAMDELAHQLKMDPVQLRLINYAEKDPDSDLPFSSKHLKDCYQQAAERFGWSRRNPTPGQMRQGNQLIGHGMASATYPANRSSAEAIVRLLPNGRIFVGSGTQELGTGMYTIMAQTAADGLRMDPALVDVKLGDSTLPHAPVSGGSQSSASVCPAITDACGQVLTKLVNLAAADAASPLHGMKPEQIEFQHGRLSARTNASKGETFQALLARNGGQPIEAKGMADKGEDAKQMAAHSFGAVFAEVGVDVDTHMVQVKRIVATYDIGTLMNAKTGSSQLMGGIVWGVSTALQEDTHLDNHIGRFVNMNLAEYHVPVNRDIGSIDVTALNFPDTKFNPLGARGIGEIGITGVAAAIGNAVFNATGKRIRNYPITVDKIMLAS